MPPTIDQFAKGIASIWTAGLLWIAEVLPIDAFPTWIKELGLPVSFLVAVAYALVSVHRAYCKSEEGRRKDWVEFCTKLEDMQEKGNETRERLIRATEDQTREFHNLADQLRNRPCQITRDRL